MGIVYAEEVLPPAPPAWAHGVAGEGGMHTEDTYASLIGYTAQPGVGMDSVALGSLAAAEHGEAQAVLYGGNGTGGDRGAKTAAQSADHALTGHQRALPGHKRVIAEQVKLFTCLQMPGCNELPRHVRGSNKICICELPCFLLRRSIRCGICQRLMPASVAFPLGSHCPPLTWTSWAANLRAN